MVSSEHLYTLKQSVWPDWPRGWTAGGGGGGSRVEVGVEVGFTAEGRENGPEPWQERFSAQTGPEG